MRGTRLDPKLDVSPIISPPLWDGGFSDWVPFLNGFWAELRALTRRVDDPVQWNRFHLTTKKGPGRGHALLGSLADLFSLPVGLVRSIQAVGGKDLAERMDWLLANRPVLEEVFGSMPFTPFRRLQAIADSEGKSRVIALLDYWSQTALYPFHLFLFNILEKIPQDVTFDQGSFVDKIRG